MATFKKPKRNFRPRVTHSDDEIENLDSQDGENGRDEISETRKTINKFKEEQKERKKQQSLLSFEEDLNDGDDGEIFKVKKSSQSRKLMKKKQKEKKKKNEIQEGIVADTSKIMNVPKPVSKEDDSAIVAIANSIDMGMGLSSDESEGEGGEAPHQPRFSHPESVKKILQSGQIPDAALIHAARKRRQMVREMGDYIPLEDNQKADKNTSRLIRDDENDLSDDGESARLTFTVDTSLEDQERRKEAFLAAQQEGCDLESLEEWENQQMGKVGISSYDPPLPPCPPPPTLTQSQPQPPTIVVTTEGFIKMLKDRLTSLEEVHHGHERELAALEEEAESCRVDCENCEEETPKLAERFAFYQELKGYVDHLVDCLDEKVPLIDSLEERVNELYQQRTTHLIERRRQDISDQGELFRPLANLLPGQPAEINESEVQLRRAAEREGRRTRRRRGRELRGVVGHKEGLSTDDEEMEADVSNFNSEKAALDCECLEVFEDVIDDFSSMTSIMGKFEEWKERDPQLYKDAYITLCLPRVIAPVLRTQILTWNPLEKGDLDDIKCLHSLYLYGLVGEETENDVANDPDLLLTSIVVEKVITTKLIQLVEHSWDPMSSKQTLRLVGLTSRLIQDFPTISTGAGKNIETLLKAVAQKMKESLENDIYVMVLGKTTLERFSSCSTFVNRQFWSGVKLLRNMISWQGLIADKLLQDMALGALLNRTLMVAIRATYDPKEALNKIKGVILSLPRTWITRSPAPLHLNMMKGHLLHLAKTVDVSIHGHRDLIENIAKLLSSLAASDMSDEVMEKYH